MIFKLKQLGKIFVKAAKEWYSKDPFRESAVIAYYSIFSIPGLLVLIITLAGYFFGREAVSGHVYNEVNAVMGADAAKQIQQIVQRASEIESTVWATIVGIVTIIVGATGVFAQLQKSLNTIWEVKPDAKGSGIWNLIKVRLFSFGLIISIAFILLVALIISSILSAVSNWLERHWPDFILFLFQGINFLVSLAIIAFLFALMFKFLPDAKIKWRNVYIGAIVTALLFNLGQAALGFYFGKAEPGEGYGAAGSIILLLLWASYSSMIVFFGAEFTRAYANHFEGVIKPSEHAVRKPDLAKQDREKLAGET